MRRFWEFMSSPVSHGLVLIVFCIFLGISAIMVVSIRLTSDENAQLKAECDSLKAAIARYPDPMIDSIAHRDGKTIFYRHPPTIIGCLDSMRNIKTIIPIPVHIVPEVDVIIKSRVHPDSCTSDLPPEGK